MLQQVNSKKPRLCVRYFNKPCLLNLKSLNHLEHEMQPGQREICSCCIKSLKKVSLQLFLVGFSVTDLTKWTMFSLHCVICRQVHLSEYVVTLASNPYALWIYYFKLNCTNCHKMSYDFFIFVFQASWCSSVLH